MEWMDVYVGDEMLFEFEKVSHIPAAGDTFTIELPAVNNTRILRVLRRTFVGNNVGEMRGVELYCEDI